MTVNAIGEVDVSQDGNGDPLKLGDVAQVILSGRQRLGSSLPRWVRIPFSMFRSKATKQFLQVLDVWMVSRVE